jgi:peptidoglycan/xylan/chitin deacetylase (PgdA/CDA1 family)
VAGARRAVPVLVYHSVVQDTTPAMAPFDVHPEQLEAHLGFLASSKWQPIPLALWAAWLRSGGHVELPEHPVVLTFDDAFRDFLTAAALLRRFEVPATLFAPTAHVGAESTWMPELRPLLDWDELRSLADDGFEIGAHAHAHYPLDERPTAEIVRDVHESRRHFAEQFGEPPKSFAYPHGYHDRRVIQAVRANGFEYACAVRDALSFEGDSPFAISRLFVGWDTDVPALARVLERGRVTPRRHELVRTKGWRAFRRVRRRVHAR